ncbi:hypothetical protein BH10PSE7_BH10PSE7_43470 [soil metagenome]
MNGENSIYEFGNGILVHRGDLLEEQVARYTLPGNSNLHEPVEEDWLRRLVAGIAADKAVFIDIGAGIGYYSILVKKLRPRSQVFAVEPLPRHIEACKRNFVLNDLPEPPVTIVPAAIATTSGSALLTDGGYGSHLTPAPGASAITVDTMTLADLVALTGAPVNIVKIDIQGYERDVLQESRGVLSSGMLDYLVVGTHSAGIHRDIRTLLEDCGTVMFDDPAPAFQPDGLIVADLRRL